MNEKKETERKQAIRILNDCTKYCSSSVEARESCGGCAVNGYISRATKEQLKAEGINYPFINYAGWLRIWVQAGKFIPKKYLIVVMEELKDNNRAYLGALVEDVEYFGLNACDEVKNIFNIFLNGFEVGKK